MFEFRSLEVVHWDYWQRFQLPLDASVITVVGPNGSGKTTLLDALRTLLAIEDRDTARDYKTYLRHNGKGTAWLRAVVSNRPDRRGGRPFFPIKDEAVTLACRIRKRGGDWSRDYQIVAGDVPVETLEQGGEWLGLRDYRVRLAGAGLTRAICRVLTLEQGATDKLCQLSARELLQLVFDVFEDKAVLDDYQRAKSEQLDVEKEIEQLRHGLDELHLKLESSKVDVRSFEEGQALRNQRQRLQAEIAPKIELADLRATLDGARPRLTGLRRALRERRSAHDVLLAREANAIGERESLAAQMRQARGDVRDCDAAFIAARDHARDAEQLVKRRDELARLQAQRGEVDVDALSRRVEEGRRRQAELKLEAERDRQRGGEVAAQLSALSGGGRIVEPFERDFRAALDRAGIGHRVLTELVEIADPKWSVALEALALAPYRHLVVLEDARDEAQAWKLGEQMQYRHFVVSQRAPVEKATKGSLLEVVNFAAEPPAWLPRQLDRIERVEDIDAGLELAQGGYLDHPQGLPAREPRRSPHRRRCAALRRRGARVAPGRPARRTRRDRAACAVARGRAGRAAQARRYRTGAPARLDAGGTGHARGGVRRCRRTPAGAGRGGAGRRPCGGRSARSPRRAGSAGQGRKHRPRHARRRDPRAVQRTARARPADRAGAERWCSASSSSVAGAR